MATAHIGNLVIDNTGEIKVVIEGGIAGVGDYVKTNFAPEQAYKVYGLKLVQDLPIVFLLDYNGLELTAHALKAV